MKRRKLRKTAKPGGIRSLELREQLRKNVDVFIESMKDPGKRAAFIKSQKRIVNPEKVTFRKSGRFPGITVNVVQKKVPGTGMARIRNVPDIGPVALTFLFYRTPKEMVEKRGSSFDKGVREHEATHIWTEIIRHPLHANMYGRKKGKFYPSLIKEILLKEMIAHAKPGYFFRRGSVDISNRLAQAVEIYAKERGYNREKEHEIYQKWECQLDKKLLAIMRALEKLPQGEVLIVLNQSSWEKLEQDLENRILARKRD